MSVKRLLTVCLASTIAFTTLTCTDAADPVSPVEPQLARKIKPPPAPPVELLEYYIYQQGGENYVHILAKGDFPRANLNVVQDYIFNGIRDDNYSIFYEYTTFAPDPVGAEDLADKGLWEFDEDAQAWHIDIPWNGETWYRDYDLPDYPRSETHFPDFPHSNVDGEGGDPYAFDIKFQKENGDYIKGYQPQGIILGGEETHEPVMDVTDLAFNSDFHTDAGTIYSYATYEGTTGTPIYIDQIIVDESSFTCEVQTIRERIDKVKVTRQVTTVSVRAQVILSSGVGEPLPEAWIHVMLAKDTDGPDGQPDFLDSFTSTYGSEPWAEGWTVSTQFENDETVFELRLAVPYVYATDLQNQMVYDPVLNQDGNESDWYTINAGPITEFNKFPIALTGTFTVNCGK